MTVLKGQGHSAKRSRLLSLQILVIMPMTSETSNIGLMIKGHGPAKVRPLHNISFRNMLGPKSYKLICSSNRL